MRWLSNLAIVALVFAGGALATPRTAGARDSAYPSSQSPHSMPASLVPVVTKALAHGLRGPWLAHTSAHGATFFNPDQRIRASFRDNEARIRLGGGRRIAMTIAGYSLDGHGQQLDACSTYHGRSNRIHARIARGVSVWYANTPWGIEQGFTVGRPARPASTTVLSFVWRSSLHARIEHDGIGWRDAAGKTILHYGSLFAYDESHRALPARIVLHGHRLSLIVDTRNAAYPVTIDPLLSTRVALQDPDPATNDQFATQVAVSADGKTAVVGAFGADNAAGRAYIFTRSGATWSSSPTATFTDPAATANDLFGAAVALSPDGQVALIGAPQTSVTGKAYLYEQTGGVWNTTPSETFADPNPNPNYDLFGMSVSLNTDGTVAVIGAPQTIYQMGGEGQAYIFEQTASGWAATPVLPFVTANVDNLALGQAVAVSADGHTAVITDPKASTISGTGAAYVFSNSSGPWIRTATIDDPTGAASDDFGGAAALSANGATLAVSASGAAGSSGVAYLFSQSNGAWSAVPLATIPDPASQAGDEFATSLSLSSDDSTLLVSAYSTVGSTTPSSATGIAYIFSQTAGTWSTQPSLHMADPSTSGRTGFGVSTALSSDGSTAVIGANSMASGVAGNAYVYVNDVDLSVAAAATASSITTGQQVTYDFTINNGDATISATNVALTAILPSGLSFVSASAAGGSCSENGNAVTCALAALSPMAQWKPDITVTAANAGTYTTSAAVTADQPDPNASNNTASVTTTVTTATSNPPPPPTNASGSSGGGGALGWGTLAMLALACLFDVRRRASRSFSKT